MKSSPRYRGVGLGGTSTHMIYHIHFNLILNIYKLKNVILPVKK